jgi:hypothetical protein
MTKLKFTLFVWVLLISCTSKPVSDTENFNEFFEKFKSDSLFQVNRVKFPWKIPTEDGEELTINKTEWQHSSFDYQEEFATRSIDAYTQETRTYGDTVRIELRGVDNGIHVDFIFATIDNKWFLVSEEDLSD